MIVIMAQRGESLRESSCLRGRRKVLNVTIIAFAGKAVRDCCLVICRIIARLRLKITQVPITLYLCVIICRIIAHKFTQVSITLYFNTDSNPLKFTIMNNDLDFFPFPGT